MTARQASALVSWAALWIVASTAWGQQPNVRIGYVYPAGGKQGTTFEAVVGGQFMAGVTQVHVTGGGVQAKIVDLARPIQGKELNDLRIKLDDLMARKAVVKKDFAALEAFRSFQKAKDIKKPSGTSDEEIQRLQKKYAGATWTAEDDKLIAEIRMKISKGNRRPANPAISELATVQFTVAADAEPGRRELRIVNPVATSNPLVFCIGTLPEYSQPASREVAQQKSAIAKTANLPRGGKAAGDTEISLPAVVNGQILPGAVDRYRFEAKKGQRLVLTLAARQLIPYIADAVPGWFQATLTLYDAKGQEVAYDDDFRFDPDPVLYLEVPADGPYVVEIKDAIYRGREDFVYRLSIGEVPFVTGIFPLGGKVGDKNTVQLTGWNLPVEKLTRDDANTPPGVVPLCVRDKAGLSNSMPFALSSLPECLEKEPNNDPAHAQRVSLPVVIDGRVDRPDDIDVFAFEGHAGGQFVAEVYARRLNSPVDSLLKLTDAAGKQLALNDDQEDKGAGLVTHHADSRIALTLPADGVYYLHLSDSQHNGGPEYAYRLRISPPQPDFELRAVPSNLNVRAGASVPVTVFALRRDGFAGEIALSLKDPPPGFTVSGGRIPADQDQVKITLSAPAVSREEPVSVFLEGRATIDGREVSHPAVPAENMTQAFEYHHLVPAQELLVSVAPGAPRTAVKIISKTPVKIAAGGTAHVRIGIPPGALARFDIALSDPPAGIRIKGVIGSGDEAELILQSDSSKVHPGMKGNLLLTAKPKNAKNPNKNKGQGPQVALPAIPFEVVGP